MITDRMLRMFEEGPRSQPGSVMNDQSSSASATSSRRSVHPGAAGARARPKHARRGMLLGEVGMLLAVVGTLLHHEIISFKWIIVGLVIGSVIGTAMSIWIPMTKMPERIALSHAFGGLAAALVGVAEYHAPRRRDLDALADGAPLGFEVFLGSLTFTGSLMAFGKLQGFITGAPLTFKGQNAINIGLFVGALAMLRLRDRIPARRRASSTRCAALGLAARRARWCCPSAAPTCRSSSRCSTRTPVSRRAATGFALNNNVLIICGALDGASGFILVDDDEQGDEPLVRQRPLRRVRHRRRRAAAPAAAAAAPAPASNEATIEDAASVLARRAVGHRRSRLRHGGVAGAARRARSRRRAREARQRRAVRDSSRRRPHARAT